MTMRDDQGGRATACRYSRSRATQLVNNTLCVRDGRFTGRLRAVMHQEWRYKCSTFLEERKVSLQKCGLPSSVHGV